MDKLKIYYGEDSWSKEDGVKAIEEYRKTIYWKNDTELKAIDGTALKQVAGFIEIALQRDYIYNPFCGKRTKEIKARNIELHCGRCCFYSICYPGRDISVREGGEKAMEEAMSKEGQEITKTAKGMLVEWQGKEILEQGDYNQAGETIKKVKGWKKLLEDQRMSLTRPLDESKKRIIQLFSQPILVLENIKKTIDQAMFQYEHKKEMERKAEEARLEEIAKREADRLAKRAEKAEEKGQEEKAEELKQQAETMQNIAPVVAPTIEKVTGLSRKTIWKYEIVDEKLIPREYLMPNQILLGQVARATKGTLQISGIRFYEDKSVF